MENKASFFARLTPLLPQSEEMKVRLAYYLAKYGHRAQFRKEIVDGEHVRYFEHPRRVAIILIDELKIIDSDCIVAGLMHDTLEDTDDLTPQLLEYSIGPTATSYIKTVSKVPKEGYIGRLASCTKYQPLIIKGCDKLDNMRHLFGEDVSLDFAKKQVIEVKRDYLPIFDRMVMLTPPEFKGAAQYLRDEILKITERSATILEMKGVQF